MDTSLELYREVLLAHNEKPYHFGPLEHPTHQANANNPLCGDEVVVYLQVAENAVKTLTFTGQSCAICRASASLMMKYLEGKSVADAEAAVQHVLDWLNDPNVSLALSDAGELQALAGVRKFPMRIKCATLAWHAFSQALQQPLAG